MGSFAKGFIAGFIIAAIIFGVFAGAVHARHKNREETKYVELLLEVEAMRESIINLSNDELLDMPDIRRAADGASAEFERRRDEALERFRSGIVDR